MAVAWFCVTRLLYGTSDKFVHYSSQELVEPCLLTFSLLAPADLSDERLGVLNLVERSQNEGHSVCSASATLGACSCNTEAVATTSGARSQRLACNRKALGGDGERWDLSTHTRVRTSWAASQHLGPGLNGLQGLWQQSGKDNQSPKARTDADWRHQCSLSTPAQAWKPGSNRFRTG